MFPVTGLKILGWVGTHIFFIFFSRKKKLILCILKGISPFKMHKIMFFLEKPVSYRSVINIYFGCSKEPLVENKENLFLEYAILSGGLVL